MRPTDQFLHVDAINTAFSAKRSAEFKFKGESHSFWEMVYVKEGKVGVSAGSRVYTLSRGDVIFHKPYEFHSIWSAENTEPTHLIISFRLTGRGAEQLKDTVLRAGSFEKKLLDGLVESTLKNHESNYNFLDFSGNNDIDYSCFVYTLDLLLCRFLKHADTAPPEKSESALIFEKVVSYMESNIELSPSNEELAKYANVSVSTLKRIFLKYSSLGIHSYLKALKIVKAKALLRDGIPVCHVAQLLGFSNQNNFSAAFKRDVGVSPSEYR